MPGKRKRVSKGTSAKKKVKRALFKEKKKARVTNVVRSIGPIAPRAIVKMKYAHEQIIPASGALPFTRTFNANSTFDPDRTGIGHQPYGRDTYVTLYNRYRVFKIKYRAQFIIAATSYSCGVYCNNSASAPATAELFFETPGAKSTVAFASKVGHLRGSINLPRIVGQTPVQYKSDDRFQAQSGTDPAEIIGLHFFAADVGTNTVSAGLFRVQLTYYVEWFDQIDLAQS